jgi:hypothetical protein
MLAIPIGEIRWDEEKLGDRRDVSRKFPESGTGGQWASALCWQRGWSATIGPSAVPTGLGSSVRLASPAQGETRGQTREKLGDRRDVSRKFPESGTGGQRASALCWQRGWSATIGPSAVPTGLGSSVRLASLAQGRLLCGWNGVVLFARRWWPTRQTAQTKACRALLGPDSPFDFAQGRLGAAVPTCSLPALRVPQTESSTPCAKNPLDLLPLSVYINVFHGHRDAPGAVFRRNLRLGSQIQKSSILDVPWRIYLNEVCA